MASSSSASNSSFVFSANKAENQSTASNRSIENIFAKPATNGPNDLPKRMFSFGRSVSKSSEEDQATKAIKRPNTDATDSNVLAKIPTISSIPNVQFVSGHPLNTNNIPSSIVSTSETDVSKELNAAQVIQKPTFSFATTTQSTSSPVPLSISWMPFPFNAGASAVTTTTAAPNTFGEAAFAQSTPTQSIFGGAEAPSTCRCSSVSASVSPASNIEVCKSHFNGFIF